MSGEIELTNVASRNFCTHLTDNNQAVVAEASDEENPEAKRKSGCHTFKCSCSNKVFAIFLAVLLIITMATVVTLAYMYVKQPLKKVVCMTEGCVIAASHLLSNMNHKADPCVDFYEFACGQRIRNLARNSKKSVHLKSILEDSVNERIRALLESDEEDGAFYRKKPKTLYSSCMNLNLIRKRGVEPFLKLINATGKFPALDPTWRETGFNLETLLKKLANLGIFPLVEFGVLEKPGFFAFYVKESPLILNKYILNKYNYLDEVDIAYRKWLVDNLVLMRRHSRHDIETDVEDVLNLRYEIDDVRRNRTDNAQVSGQNVLKTNVSSLLDLYPWVNWKMLFEHFNEKVLVTGDTAVFSFTGPRYLDNLNKVMANVSRRTLANYLMSHLIKFTDALGPDYTRLTDTLLQKVERIPPRPRWESCVRQSVVMFPYLVDRMYIEEYFNAQDIQTIKTVIEEITLALKSYVDNSNWLTKQTKSNALKKLQEVKLKIGYSEFVQHDSRINSLYDHIYVNETEYMENIIAFNQLQTSGRDVNKVIEAVSRHKWPVNAISSNGYMDVISNELILPAGILQYPVYSSFYTSSMVYGAIGMFIGHELLHGMYNLNHWMKLRSDWWNKNDRDEQTRRSKCFVDQYNHLSFQSFKVNGTSTLDENICDNGGLKQSFNAYRNFIKRKGLEELQLPGIELNHNQIFFLAFAQTWCSSMLPEDMYYSTKEGHAPDIFRVIGTLQNSGEFSETFQCVSGTPMNPRNKCALF